MRGCSDLMHPLSAGRASSFFILWKAAQTLYTDCVPTINPVNYIVNHIRRLLYEHLSSHHRRGHEFQADSALDLLVHVINQLQIET
jgi:hypothetical protein